MVKNELSFSNNDNAVFQYRIDLLPKRRKYNFRLIPINEPLHWGLHHRHTMRARKYFPTRGKQSTSVLNGPYKNKARNSHKATTG